MVEERHWTASIFFRFFDSFPGIYAALGGFIILMLRIYPTSITAWSKRSRASPGAFDDCRLSSRRESTGLVVVAQRLQAIQIVRARVEEALPFRDSLFCISICLCRCDANGVCRQFI
jgi:hypothetical protein